MRWQLRHGEWYLVGENGRWYGAVYRYNGGWCAQTQLNGLTTGPGPLKWAQDTLWNFCVRVYKPVGVTEVVCE